MLFRSAEAAAKPPREPLRLRVLVVDDHPSTREAVIHELTVAGAEGVAAGSGAEALTALRQAMSSGRPFDVALLDLLLPDLDALALAHEIHAQPGLQAARLVLLAPLGQGLEPNLLRTVGLAAHLVKPVKRARLLETVRAVHAGEVALAATSAAERPAELIHPDAGRSGIRLLLAEDNLVNQKVALKLLSKLGFSADVAHNGREALVALARQPYEVVLMDCQMPELDGYETTRALRREEADGTYGTRPPHFVVALTANAMAGDREKCLAAGMDDFITKPIDLAQLESVLLRAVEARRLALAPAANRSGTAPIAGAAEPTLDPVFLTPLRVPGEPEALGELVALFLQDAVARLDAFRQALAAHDAAGIKSAAHSLKGSAANLGGRRLARLASDVEVAVKTADWSALNAMFPEVEAELARLREALLAQS